MTITTQMPIRDYEFWGYAGDHAIYLTEEELDKVEKRLEEIHPHGIDEVALNDFFADEADTIAEWLGFSNFEEILKRAG